MSFDFQYETAAEDRQNVVAFCVKTEPPRFVFLDNIFTGLAISIQSTVVWNVVQEVGGGVMIKELLEQV